MKWHTSVAVIAALCLSLFCSYPPQNSYAQAQRKPEAKITVLSPMGKPPGIQVQALAPRPNTLDGKTVYLVNDGFVGTDILLKEMDAWFKTNMPKVTAVYKRKAGSFTAEDPALWAELKDKADAVVMGMGH